MISLHCHICPLPPTRTHSTTSHLLPRLVPQLCAGRYLECMLCFHTQHDVLFVCDTDKCPYCICAGRLPGVAVNVNCLVCVGQFLRCDQFWVQGSDVLILCVLRTLFHVVTQPIVATSPYRVHRLHILPGRLPGVAVAVDCLVCVGAGFCAATSAHIMRVTYFDPRRHTTYRRHTSPYRIYYQGDANVNMATSPFRCFVCRRDGAGASAGAGAGACASAGAGACASAGAGAGASAGADSGLGAAPPSELRVRDGFTYEDKARAPAQRSAEHKSSVIVDSSDAEDFDESEAEEGEDEEKEDGHSLVEDMAAAEPVMTRVKPPRRHRRDARRRSDAPGAPVAHRRRPGTPIRTPNAHAPHVMRGLSMSR